MRIVVAYADPLRHMTIDLDIAEGATVKDAIEKAAPGSILHLQDASAVGVWGKVRPLDYPLRDGDRIELYRPLVADPKTARRKRAATR